MCTPRCSPFCCQVSEPPLHEIHSERCKVGAGVKNEARMLDKPLVNLGCFVRSDIIQNNMHLQILWDLFIL